MIYKMIILKNYNSELEADIAKELLISNGINCFIIKEDPTSMGLCRGAKIKVFEKDAESAREVLGIKN